MKETLLSEWKLLQLLCVSRARSRDVPRWLWRIIVEMQLGRRRCCPSSVARTGTNWRSSVIATVALTICQSVSQSHLTSCTDDDDDDITVAAAAAAAVTSANCRYTWCRQNAITWPASHLLAHLNSFYSSLPSPSLPPHTRCPRCRLRPSLDDLLVPVFIIVIVTVPGSRDTRVTSSDR